MLAELLCYRLKLVKSEEIDGLQIDHEVHGGMFILVTHVSDFRAVSRLELYAETPSTPMIISVDSADIDKPALKTPRHAPPPMILTDFSMLVPCIRNVGYSIWAEFLGMINLIIFIKSLSNLSHGLENGKRSTV